MIKAFDSSTLDTEMDEFFETTGYSGAVAPWRETPETGADTDDGDEEERLLGEAEGHPFRGNQWTYHATSIETARKIRQQGLKPGEDNVVYLADTLFGAVPYGLPHVDTHGEFAVALIDKTKIPSHRQEEGYATVPNVLPEDISDILIFNSNQFETTHWGDVRPGSKVPKPLRTMGDKEGHAFYGNQWTKKAAAPEPEPIAPAPEPAPIVEPTPAPVMQPVELTKEQLAVSLAQQLHVDIVRMAQELKRDKVQITYPSINPNTAIGRRNTMVVHTGMQLMQEARQQLRDAGVNPPGIQLRFRSAGNETYASAYKRSITVNTSQPVWLTRERVADAKKQEEYTGFKANGHPTGTLVHEMGHVLHQRNVEHADAVAGKLKKNWRTEEAVSPTYTEMRVSEPYSGLGVSRYAKKNKNEFVAETFSGLVAGKKYSEDIMKEYHSYHGPKVPGKKAA